MPLSIIRNDITKMKVDAIVNAANSTLTGGGGVDGAIHKAAGRELLEECLTLNGCKVGEAKLTKGYNLPCKYIIHTVGPIWRDGIHNEEELLANAYKNSLKLAKDNNFESIAFPLISSGAYGFPKDRALKIAVRVIGDFLLQNDMLVYLVVFDKNAVSLSEKLFLSISKYIDDNYVDEKEKGFRRRSRFNNEFLEDCDFYAPKEYSCNKEKRSLEDIINNIDETFTKMLLRLIDQKKMTDAETYKKANIDRKLFSKIRNDMDYKPSKITAISFAIALELSLDETKDLLLKAGFALSPSSKFDVIIKYFIESGNYDIFEINQALFTFDQKALFGY